MPAPRQIHRAVIAALSLLAVPQAVPQPPSPDSAPELTLKSTSRMVQLDVSVADASGNPVHGLQKKDFVLADDSHPRDIQFFAGEVNADKTASSSAIAEPPYGMYSNRPGPADSRIVTAVVFDAVIRPEDLQKNVPGILAVGNHSVSAQFRLNWVIGHAIGAIERMVPGEMMAIYAACPELRLVQDFTSDPGLLLASVNALVLPPVPNAKDKKPSRTIDTFVPPMLSALREVAGRMSGMSGRKSVIWLSQAYGTEMKPAAIKPETDSTVTAFSDLNIPLYAMDTRFNPICEDPPMSPIETFNLSPSAPAQAPFSTTNNRAAVLGPRGATAILTCTNATDISDAWMEDLAQATGGRAFSGGKVDAVHFAGGGGQFSLARSGDAISSALRIAIDDSRYAYELGFYVPDSKLDDKFHRLSVTIPAEANLELRYRSGYNASAGAVAAPEPNLRQAPSVNSDEVGIRAGVEWPSPNELRVSLALDPATVTRTSNGAVILDETFTETDSLEKQVAKFRETVPVPSTGGQDGMVRYTRTVKLAKGAFLLHITVRDQATNRVGSITIPIGKQ